MIYDDLPILLQWWIFFYADHMRRSFSRHPVPHSNRSPPQVMHPPKLRGLSSGKNCGRPVELSAAFQFQWENHRKIIIFNSYVKLPGSTDWLNWLMLKFLLVPASTEINFKTWWEKPSWGQVNVETKISRIACLKPGLFNRSIMAPLENLGQVKFVKEDVEKALEEVLGFNG